MANSEFYRQVHLEVTIANNTLNTFIGGKPRSWMLNDNAVRVFGGGAVPPTVRQQTGPLRRHKKPKNPPTPDKGPSPTESPNTPHQILPTEAEKAVASTTGGANPRIISADTIRTSSPRPTAADRNRNIGPTGPEGTQEQPVDLCGESLSAVEVENMLPSPAPSKSPPGPEHRQLQDQTGHKRPGDDLDTQDPRPLKRAMSSSEATQPQSRRPSQIVHGIMGDSTNGGHSVTSGDIDPGSSSGGGCGGSSLAVETAFGPRTVFTLASSPLPSPLRLTFPGAATSNQVMPGQDQALGAKKKKESHAFITKLTTFARQQAAIGTPLNRSEKVRALFLREAILKGDLMYLLIHQILCFVGVASEEAKRNANITTMHQKGADFMRTFYPDHEDQPLSQTCLTFFSNLPWQLGEERSSRMMVALTDARLFFSDGYQVC